MLSFLFREFLINEIQMLDMKKSYENKFISEYNKIIILMQKILHIVVTLTRKNMNLPYSMRMYWTIFWQPTVHVHKNIFEKTLIEVGSS